MPKKPREIAIAVGDVFKAPAGDLEVLKVGLVGCQCRWTTPSGNVYESWISQDTLTQYQKKLPVSELRPKKP